jgi:hypothetical protein
METPEGKHDMKKKHLRLVVDNGPRRLDDASLMFAFWWASCAYPLTWWF